MRKDAKTQWRIGNKLNYYIDKLVRLLITVYRRGE